MSALINDMSDKADEAFTLVEAALEEFLYEMDEQTARRFYVTFFREHEMLDRELPHCPGVDGVMPTLNFGIVTRNRVIRKIQGIREIESFVRSITAEARYIREQAFELHKKWLDENPCVCDVCIYRWN